MIPILRSNQFTWSPCRAWSCLTGQSQGTWFPGFRPPCSCCEACRSSPKWVSPSLSTDNAVKCCKMWGEGAVCMKQKIKLYYGFCLTSLGLCLVRMFGSPLASRWEGHWINFKKHLGDINGISMWITNVDCFSHWELVWGLACVFGGVVVGFFLTWDFPGILHPIRCGGGRKGHSVSACYKIPY